MTTADAPTWNGSVGRGLNAGLIPARPVKVLGIGDQVRVEQGRVPIGIRIHRSTHRRLKRLAREWGLPIGEALDRAVAMVPPVQCELPVGRPKSTRPVRAYMRTTRKEGNRVCNAANSDVA